MRLATRDDKAAIEQIVNHPELRTWYADRRVATFDAARYLAGDSFVVIGDEGCFLAEALVDRHVVHTNLLPHCRGAQAVRASREAMEIAFLETECRNLVSMVPDTLPHALWLAKTMGLRTLFRRELCWPWDGRVWGMTFVGLTIDEWILTGACKQHGAWFHDKLADEQTHAFDAVHDCYVGAVVRMISAGQVHKAVDLYNRWARFALYETIEVLTEDPLRIDIRSHILRVEEGDFNVEVKSCQKLALQ